MSRQGNPHQQDTWFFERLRDAKIEIQMFLVNGIRLIGRIDRFDRYTVLLTRGGHSQVVYKHTISTVVPSADFPVEPTEP